MTLWEKFVKKSSNRFHDKIKAFSLRITFYFDYNEIVKSDTGPFMIERLTIYVFFLPKNT